MCRIYISWLVGLVVIGGGYPAYAEDTLTVTLQVDPADFQVYREGTWDKV